MCQRSAGLPPGTKEAVYQSMAKPKPKPKPKANDSSPFPPRGLRLKGVGEPVLLGVAMCFVPTASVRPQQPTNCVVIARPCLGEGSAHARPAEWGERTWRTAGTTRGGAGHPGLTHTETQRGRLWTA